jgi:DNA-binding transcriptional ArsR family regulator
MLHSLSSLIFNDYRRRVLGLLLLHPERQWHVREIARLTGTTAGTLHKELSRLAQAGILRRVEQGKQVYYSANHDCPIFAELASILRKISLDAITPNQASPDGHPDFAADRIISLFAGIHMDYRAKTRRRSHE